MVVLADNSGENFGLPSLQVINNLNFGLQSVMTPPRDTLRLLPFLIKLFSSIGSSMGSISFSIPSMINTSPFSIHLVRPSLNFFSSLILTVTKYGQLVSGLISENLFLIHVVPQFYGSINKGYLSEDSTIIPFQIDKTSLGNPSKFHWEIVASSTKKLFKSL